MPDSKDEVADHFDKLAYAVSLLNGAERLAHTARGQPIATIGIPFYLLIGFSIENGIKALLDFQRCEGGWRKSHDLGDLLSRTKDLRELLWPGAEDSILHLSRYHKEHWFRYPEKATTADVYSSQTTLILVDHLLTMIARLTNYHPEKSHCG